MPCGYHSFSQRGQSILLNKKYLPLLVLLPDKLNTLGWILSLTFMVRSRIWTSLLVAPFSCNPSLVSAASTKPGLMAKRAEKTKFDRYPHINLVPFILETTCEMLITHQLLSETLGPPSRVFSTVPSPNNNSWQPLRDSWDLLSHSAASYIRFLCLQVPATRDCTQPFSVSSTLQLCHVALLRHHLIRR